MLTYNQPDARGHFGPYGGTFVSETLIHALAQLKDAYEHYRHDEAFKAEFPVSSPTSSAAPARSTTPTDSAGRSVGRRSISSAKT